MWYVPLCQPYMHLSDFKGRLSVNVQQAGELHCMAACVCYSLDTKCEPDISHIYRCTRLVVL